MAKKKKKVDERPNPKILSQKDRVDSAKKLDDLDQGVVTIPPDAVINVPISGNFRWAIEDTLHYIMRDMSSDEIIVAMYHIKTGYEKMEGEAPPRDKALWTLMSLLSEINYQAADQNLTYHTGKPINEELAGIINTMNKGDIEAAKQMADYNAKYKEWHKQRDENIKKSNEGSDQ